MSTSKKSPLAEMRASVKRLNEKAELFAAQTVMARSEEPETESQRLFNAHAQFRTAIVATTARMVNNADRIRRRSRRRALIELSPLQTATQEAVNVDNDTPAETESEGQ